MSEDPNCDPAEREVKDFQLRQMMKIRVFDTPEDLPRERSSLLAISNKYGLTFVGQDRKLKVFFTKDIISAAKKEGNPSKIVENVKGQVVNLNLPIHHLALCCDELTLSVCCTSEETTLSLEFYDVRTFFNTARQEKIPFASFTPSSGRGMSVQDLKWSPTEAFRLAVCLLDGSMMVLDVKDSITISAQLPASEGITCICWSPKGKQVSAGKQNATVVQYTPALQEKKVIPCPSFYSSESPAKVLDVLWLSTYNFAVVYAAADGSLETPPDLVVVTIPKKDERKGERFLNFSEIVYGSCIERQHHYFLNHIEDWDLILAASAASIDISIIAKQEDKVNWELWLLDDESRGELPVTMSNDDTLPMGMGIDYTSQGDIHISSDRILPPAPTLLVLSTDGVLCPFSLLNLNPEAKQLVKPANRLTMDGEKPPLVKSAPRTQAVAVSKPPPVFPSFKFSSTPASSSAPLAPAPVSSSSSALFSFTNPPASSTPPLLSFNSAQSSASTLPSLSSFTFAAPKPSTAAPSGLPVLTGPPVSFNALTAKPPAEGLGTSTQGTVASPIIGQKGPVEPATPNIRVNLSDRFLAADTPAPAVLAATPQFSLTSTPKIPLDATNQHKPQFIINKAAVPGVTRPVQSSTPSAAVQKPSSASAQPSQGSSAKAVEKLLGQTKDSDPVMTGIREEIAHFQKEMDELKARSDREDFSVGSNEEMKALRKESDDLHEFTLGIKEATESVHGDISTLRTNMLEGFAGVEEARSQNELNKDKNYLKLLCKKPLDPRREQQLKEIRRLYQYVKFAVEDVNDVLDVEWENHLEKKRKQKFMIVPERETLYTALANNMDIINRQKQKLERLVKDLQSLRLYNQTSVWNEPTSTSLTPSSQGLDSDLESLKNALLKASLESAPKTTSKSPSKMTPLKQTQLRNFLSKRQTPPIRSTAPANLSKSAFLSPRYYEDLDDASSTSSSSQVLEPQIHLTVEEEEEEAFLPPSHANLRHPAVVRTSSIQPQLIMDSTHLSLLQQLGGGVNNRAVSVLPLGGADSTALATKTVKHVPLPTGKVTHVERNTPTTRSATQAAAMAALSRQMNSQKTAAPLTELMLKTVPQVVNVQELKDKRPIIPVSTEFSSISVPASAAQQDHHTVEAKRNSFQSAVKIPPPQAENPPAQLRFSFGQNSRTAAVSPSTSSVSVAEPSSTRGLLPSGFSFTPNLTSSQNQGATNSQNVNQVVKTSQKAGLFIGSTNMGEQSKSSTIPSFQLPKPQEDTLGPFSGLRVGQGEEATKEAPKTTGPFTFGSPGSLSGTSFTFGSSQPKPAAAGNGSSSTSADASKSTGLVTPAAGLFKPPESAAPSAKTFSFTSTASSFPSFSSLLAAPPAVENPPVTENRAEPEASSPPESSSATTPEEASSEPSPEPNPTLSTSTPSLSPVTQTTQEASSNPVIQSPPVLEVSSPASPAAEIVIVNAPVQETTPATLHTPASVEQVTSTETVAPASTPAAPGSIFTQATVSSSSATQTVTSFTPVISTAAVSSSAVTGTVFGQPSSTAAPSSVFDTTTAESSFSKPAFGQPASGTFGSARNFTFGQSSFGAVSSFGQTPAAPAPAATVSSTGAGGGEGRLFGTASSDSASTFSFGNSSTTTGTSTGANFGQSGASMFGQTSNSAFGQGSLFGGSTTTTTSSGFGFGQPSAAFGSTSSSSVFGQQQNSNSVFGQSSSSGGLFGSGTANATPASASGFFTGLGGKPSEESANKNPFAATGAFGQNNQTGNTLFGNAEASKFGFGTPSFGEQKSSGTFSTGGGSVAAQGFGSFSTPAKTAGFGSAPVFGSPPAFGASPAFGSSATFGSVPVFSSPIGSSPGKVFGEGTSAASVGGFGFASPSNAPSFGSISNQNSSPSFGALAQQQQPQQPQSSGFGAQSSGFSGFGNSGGFGGFGNTNTNQSSSQTFGGWRS